MPLTTPGAAEAARKPGVVYNAADGSGRTYGGTIEAMPSTRPAAPSAPTITTSTQGGAFASGIGVQYSITAVDDGIESLPSSLSTLTTTGSGSTNSVTIAVPQTAGIEFYNIYGRSSGSQLYIMTVDSTTTTLKVDTGSITPAGAVPAGALTAGTALIRVPGVRGGTRVYQKDIVAVPATAIGTAGTYEYRRV